MTLDLDMKLLPGGQSTCGTLQCVESGTEPRIKNISDMTVLRTGPGAGASRSKVGLVSERQPRVSTVWNGIKVDGTWSKQVAKITLYIAENLDCKSGVYTCEVRYFNALDEERLSVAQIGKTRSTHEHDVESSQVSTLSQQKSLALEMTMHQLNNRLEDNLRHLENRMEDRVGALDKALLQLQYRLVGKIDRDNLEGQNIQREQTEGKQPLKIQQIVDNISAINKNLKNLIEESASIKNTLVRENERGFFGREASCRKRDGKYRVIPFLKEFPLVCDDETDGGGWIVIQRRSSGSVNFYRNWATYKDGFGSVADDFWLGNERVHSLTSKDQYELMVSLEFNGTKASAIYDYFSIGNEESNYTLEVGTYSGSAGDSLGQHSGAQFSTFDRDHDSLDAHCAKVYYGAWWYGPRYCHASNLNGKWNELHNKGQRWSSLSGDKPVSSSEMKIRRL